MIAPAFPAVPVPDRVAILIGDCIPEHVLQAEIAAEQAAYNVRLCRSPLTREAREYALADLARANKILGAYDPRLMVRTGGAR
jgi:hypothetical protein